MVSSVGSSNSFNALFTRPGAGQAVSAVDAVQRRADTNTRSNSNQTTDQTNTTQATTRANSQRRTADEQLGALASQISTARLNSASDTLRTAQNANNDAAGNTGSQREATANSRANLQRAGSDFIGVANNQAALTGQGRVGQNENGARGNSAANQTQARQELLSFVRQNGTADQVRSAEALFRGETQDNNNSTTTSGTATNTTTANSTAANSTTANTTTAANANSTSTAATSTANNERLTRDRDALSTLTSLNSTLRRNFNTLQSGSGQQIEITQRGSLLNFTA